MPLNLSVSPNIMYFVCTFSITRALGERQRLIVTEKVRNYGDIAFINNMFQNGWWGMHLPPPPARTDNNVSYHYANQPVRLQYDVRQILSQLF